jgi:hypothetical protein
MVLFVFLLLCVVVVVVYLVPNKNPVSHNKLSHNIKLH